MHIGHVYWPPLVNHPVKALIVDISKLHAQVRGCGEYVVAASVEFYQSMCGTMLPTPGRLHYTFNLRDLSKLVQVWSRTLHIGQSARASP